MTVKTQPSDAPPNDDPSGEGGSELMQELALKLDLALMELQRVRDANADACSHLRVALEQTHESDDQIILGHIKDAFTLLDALGKCSNCLGAKGEWIDRKDPRNPTYLQDNDEDIFEPCSQCNGTGKAGAR